MKKFFALLMVLMLMFSSTIVFADTGTNSEGIISHSEYLNLKSEGVLGEDITYDDLKEVQLRSKELEKILESNEEFIEVTNEVFTNGYVTTVKSGDVVITSGTDSSGLLGHAGIGLASGNILHIANNKSKVTTIKPLQWKKKYSSKGWTKVYRHKDRTVAKAAGEWALIKYHGSNAKYRITKNLGSTHETYCSKIVWQAYAYGPKKRNANIPKITNNIIVPYDLPYYIHKLKRVANI